MTGTRAVARSSSASRTARAWKPGGADGRSPATTWQLAASRGGGSWGCDRSTPTPVPRILEIGQGSPMWPSGDAPNIPSPSGPNRAVRLDQARHLRSGPGCDKVEFSPPAISAARGDRRAGDVGGAPARADGAGRSDGSSCGGHRRVGDSTAWFCPASGWWGRQADPLDRGTVAGHARAAYRRGRRGRGGDPHDPGETMGGAAG